MPARDLDDEEEDRRPRGRRRSGDVPRRIAPARRTRPSPALLVVLLSVAFLVLLSIGVVAYLLVQQSGRPAADDLLAHAPADAVILSGYDLDALTRNDGFRRALERRAPPDLIELDKAGLGPADLSDVLVARTVHNGNTCAVRFKTAPDPSKYLQAPAGGKGYSAFTSLAGHYRFGYFADPRTLVLADREPTIQALHNKGEKVRLTSDLRAMTDSVRGPVWRASGRIAAADWPRYQGPEEGFALRVGPSAGTATWIVPDGRLAEVHVQVLFDAPAAAPNGASALRGLLLQQGAQDTSGRLNVPDWIDTADMADIRQGYRDASVSDRGPWVTARLTLPASEALRAVGSTRP